MLTHAYLYMRIMLMPVESSVRKERIYLSFAKKLHFSGVNIVEHA